MIELPIVHRTTAARGYSSSKPAQQLRSNITRYISRFASVSTSSSRLSVCLTVRGRDGDHSTLSSTVTKRQMEAIILFVELVLKQSSRQSDASHETTIEESVRMLLNLADIGQESEFSDVSKAAMKALGQFLRVISVSEFAATISTILASENLAVSSLLTTVRALPHCSSQISKGAMTLLASRLKNVASKTRQAISPTITGIVEYICNMMKSSQEVPNFLAALNVLRAVAETADTREIPALTKALPLIIAAVDQKECTADVLECILPIRYIVSPLHLIP